MNWRISKVLLLSCLSLVCFFWVSPKVSELSDIESDYAYAVCIECDSSFNDFGKCRVCGKQAKEVGYSNGVKMTSSDEDALPIPLVGSTSEVTSSIVAAVGILSLVGAIASAVRKDSK